MTFYLYILASRSIIFESESQCFEFASISSLCISSLLMTLDKQLITDHYHINDSHFQLWPKVNWIKIGEIKLTFECFILIIYINIHDFSTCDMSKTNTFPLWMINKIEPQNWTTKLNLDIKMHVTNSKPLPLNVTLHAFYSWFENIIVAISF